MLLPLIADLIKTRMQTQRGAEVMSLQQTLRHVVAEGGMRALYRGFTPCIIRAAPANAVAFWGLESTMRLLGADGF